MSDTIKKTNEEYAKNYPLLGFDGLHQPVTVGNITEFNGRVIINLACRTIGSGAKNASYSVPSDWKDATRFRPGQVVMVEVVDGFVKKLREAQINVVGKGRVSASKTNQESALETASKEVASEVDKALANEPKPKPAPKAPEPALAEAVAGEKEDMPF